MNAIASILLWFMIAMSPQALEAFGQITGAEIVSGTMDLQEGGRAVIDAIGRQNGAVMRFQCLWLGGRPVVITKVALRGEI